jgi:hypothetical protein
MNQAEYQTIARTIFTMASALSFQTKRNHIVAINHPGAFYLRLIGVCFASLIRVLSQMEKDARSEERKSSMTHSPALSPSPGVFLSKLYVN